jgi:amino acid transporter
MYVIAIVIALLFSLPALMMVLKSPNRLDAAKGRNRLGRPHHWIVAAILVAAFVYASSFGARQLAAWLYGAPAPTWGQVRGARLLLFAPFTVPIVVLAAWLWWRQRRQIRDGVRAARNRPTIIEPSHEMRLGQD